MKILRNNTTETYYTKCRHCESELEYEYSDVQFENIPFCYIPKRTIVCPCCKNVTPVELQTKKSYKGDVFPLLPNLAPVNLPE